MLKALTIQDLAVVRHLDVEFASGLTILTGETGAGKSILIEALGLALGDRADSSMVRAGAERASVSASFDIEKNTPLKAFLKEHDLEDGGECIVRRVMGADGRSRAYCNAAPIPAQQLKQIGELLVDIHGQHAHQSLLRRPVQRALLDEFARLSKETDKVAKTYHHWREISRKLNDLQDGASDIPSRIDLLRFQADEIEALNLTAASLAALESEHRRTAHAARLTEGCESAAEQVFDGDGSALSSTVRASAIVRGLADIDAGMTAVAELLDQAAINLEEADREFNRLRANIETDPQRLQDIERQLQSIQDIARKHRCEVDAIPNRLAEIQQELNDLSGREEKVAELTETLAQSLKEYTGAADSLHKKRIRAASKMNEEITKRLRELGISHGKFAVQIEENAAQPSAHGNDEIEFLVTANPDQPVKPLKKVASGGELSRISLAIQVATTGSSGIPVLVFDEVDTGVGGPTADVVSQYLDELAEHRQILCITHLPQVASAGTHHFSIGKMVVGGITETTIQALDADERIEEIARMLGGQKITAKARAHARELLTH